MLNVFARTPRELHRVGVIKYLNARCIIAIFNGLALRNVALQQALDELDVSGNIALVGFDPTG